MDQYKNIVAGNIGDEIVPSKRRGGCVCDCDYGFIFLDSFEQYWHYAFLRITQRRKESDKYLNRCLAGHK